MRPTPNIRVTETPRFAVKPDFTGWPEHLRATTGLDWDEYRLNGPPNRASDRFQFASAVVSWWGYRDGLAWTDGTWVTWEMLPVVELPLGGHDA